MEKPTICPYCDSEVVLTSNSELYGKEYGNGKCYLCRSCKASVGVHNNSDNEPLGILATSEMKVLKKCCHELFDPIWKSHKCSRTKLYNELAELMGIHPDDCHFGHFDTPKLLKAIIIMSDTNWWQ